MTKILCLNIRNREWRQGQDLNLAVNSLYLLFIKIEFQSTFNIEFLNITRICLHHSQGCPYMHTIIQHYIHKQFEIHHIYHLYMDFGSSNCWVRPINILGKVFSNGRSYRQGPLKLSKFQKAHPAPRTLGWCGRFGKEILLIASLMRRAQPAQWGCII